MAFLRIAGKFLDTYLSTHDHISGKIHNSAVSFVDWVNQLVTVESLEVVQWCSQQ